MLCTIQYLCSLSLRTTPNIEILGSAFSLSFWDKRIDNDSMMLYIAIIVPVLPMPALQWKIIFPFSFDSDDESESLFGP